MTRSDRNVSLSGILRVGSHDEADDILYCGDHIVAEWAMNEINDGVSLSRQWWDVNYGRTPEDCRRMEHEAKDNRWVSVRYWIADREASADEIKQRAVECLYGAVDVEWGARYSEVTGYLWTDEKFQIGGHDMISELMSSVGKYLLLEITIHDKPQP